MIVRGVVKHTVWGRGEEEQEGEQGEKTTIGRMPAKERPLAECLLKSDHWLNAC